MPVRITSSEYFRVSPRFNHAAISRMQASNAQANSMSASDESWMFPIPANCYVVGGAIKGSVPSGTSTQWIVKVGTNRGDDIFGTYTISSGASLAQRLNIFAPVTVTQSDDVLPYWTPVIITTISGAAGTSATSSGSLYLLLEYVMPGNLP